MTQNKLMLSIEQQEFIVEELDKTVNQMQSTASALQDKELFGFTTEIVGSLTSCYCYLKRIQKQLQDYISTQNTDKEVKSNLKIK